MNGWKEGLPPGKYYPGMEKKFEVYYSPIGVVWHRPIKEKQVYEKNNNSH